MLEVWQQAHIGVWERRARACPERIEGLRGVRPSDDVQPLLDVISVLELRARGCARSREELVEVKLVEFPGTSDRQQLVRHLVGKQTHLRKRSIRAPAAGVLRSVIVLGALLIGIGPVEDLLLDELARRKRAERSAG